VAPARQRDVLVVDEAPLVRRRAGREPAPRLLQAARAHEIDVGRAQRARDRAEARLKELSMDDETYAKAYAELQRALVRMAAGSGE